MPSAQPLVSPVRHYAWGSHTVLPRLLGEPFPTDEPWAEVWVGAHPMDPSRLPDGTSLADVEPGLPFLVKLLAAEEPLSIQAHPDLGQARAGYAAEEAEGIPVSAPARSYKDANHKPELLVALERTQALCGFRAPDRIVAESDALGSHLFAQVVRGARDRGGGDGAVLLRLFTELTTMARQDLAVLLADVVRACARAVADPHDDLHASAWWVLRLADRYPADPGVLAPLVLELVSLGPGEGLFVGPGVLHSYLHGAGVEVQASSDNVLRGGLTAKHVDLGRLLPVVRFEVTGPHQVEARRVAPGLWAYDVPVDDFAVWRVEAGAAGAAVRVPAHGPRLAVSVQGDLDVCGTRVPQGGGAYLPAALEPVVVSGEGTCFVVAPGSGV